MNGQRITAANEENLLLKPTCEARKDQCAACYIRRRQPLLEAATGARQSGSYQGPPRGTQQRFNRATLSHASGTRAWRLTRCQAGPPKGRQTQGKGPSVQAANHLAAAALLPNKSPAGLSRPLQGSAGPRWSTQCRSLRCARSASRAPALLPGSKGANSGPLSVGPCACRTPALLPGKGAKVPPHTKGGRSVQVLALGERLPSSPAKQQGPHPTQKGGAQCRSLRLESASLVALRCCL
jgi:hypothetical protein